MQSRKAEVQEESPVTRVATWHVLQFVASPLNWITSVPRKPRSQQMCSKDAYVSEENSPERMFKKQEKIRSCRGRQRNDSKTGTLCISLMIVTK